MDLVVGGEGELPEQLVAILGDDIAADRTKVPVTNEPAVGLADRDHARHLVLHARRCVTGPNRSGGSVKCVSQSTILMPLKSA